MNKLIVGTVVVLGVFLAVFAVSSNTALGQGNGDIRKLKVEVWFWGTGNIKDVYAWVNFGGQTQGATIHYAAVKNVIYAWECKCYVKMYHGFFMFPPKQTTLGGWGNFFNVCVKNLNTAEQTCQLGNWGWSTGVKVRIPNTT